MDISQFTLSGIICDITVITNANDAEWENFIIAILQKKIPIM